MNRFFLGIVVCLGSGIASASPAPIEELTQTPLARQFGQPADLEKESAERLDMFITETLSSVACGVRVCAEWEADGADLFMALAAVRALESRGKGGILLDAQTTGLASALYLSLLGARNPPKGAGERFVEEKNWSLQVIRTRSGRVLEAVPAHVETLRHVAWVERGRGEPHVDFEKRLQEREAEGFFGLTQEKGHALYTHHFDSLTRALKDGDPDGALDALDWLTGWLAGTAEGDYLRAIEALLNRQPFDVFQALRRMEGRRGSVSQSLQYQGATLGLLVAQRARLKRQEIAFLNTLSAAKGDALICSDSAVFGTPWKLPCLGYVSPETAREQLKNHTVKETVKQPGEQGEVP